MNDLKDSHYIQNHVQRVIKDTLAGRKATPLNSSEMRFMGKRAEFLRIEETLNCDLISLLSRWSQVMGTIDLVDLMLEAQEENSLDYLEEVFNAAEEEKIKLSKDQFYEVFVSAQEQGIPFSWAVSLVSDPKNDQNSSDAPPQSSFSINSM